MKVINTHLNRYDKKTIHINLNIMYNMFKRPVHNINHCNNSNRFIIVTGIHPNHYYKSRHNSNRYNQNKQRSIKNFSKYFKPENEFMQVISKPAKRHNGASRKTYENNLQLLKRSQIVTSDYYNALDKKEIQGY